jgi:hypothetical protein
MPVVAAAVRIIALVALAVPVVAVTPLETTQMHQQEAPTRVAVAAVAAA